MTANSKVTTTTTPTYLSALEARSDLKQYGNNALLLFALELKWDIDDIHAVALDALVDGPDDKKCDLIYVNRQRGVAVVAQGYFSQQARDSAPANKAADLNTAVAWVFSMPIDQVPSRIRAAVADLRDALEEDSIDILEFWYVHNAPESPHVGGELDAVSHSAINTLRATFPESHCDVIRVIEAGSRTLDEWYRASKTPILVTDRLELVHPGGYVVEGPEWRAFSTAVPLSWLYQLYRKHKTKLFSANVRDYLGSRKADGAINVGIRRSAEAEATDFWAFNNGITVLVNEFTVDAAANRLTLNGISIVNGAQTTGAVGDLNSPPNEDAMVAARFIQCRNAKLVRLIVENNNNQNRVKASDFRSGDPVQQRLRAEFTQFGWGVVYLGGRRGLADTSARARKYEIVSETAAQALVAFHQDPVTAYNYKNRIWESDSVYGSVFNQSTHADHVIFVYTLHQAIASYKLQLTAKGESNQTSAEREALAFLRRPGAPMLLITGVGACMEEILGIRVPDLSRLRFKEREDPTMLESLWAPIVAICIHDHGDLAPAVKRRVGAPKEAEKAVAAFKRFIASTQIANRAVYTEFERHVTAERW